MAKNSIREQILVYHEKYLIGKVKSIKTVIRTMPSYDDLQQFAVTQFPVAAMVGRLPVPEDRRLSSRGLTSLERDVITSTMKIDNTIYLMEAENPDTEISNIMDDVWAKVYSDLTYGGLTIGLEIIPEEETGVLDPFVAFRLVTEVKYQHSRGGI